MKARDKLAPYIGSTFWNLTILDMLDENDEYGRILAKVRCACGREAIMPIRRVLSGHNRSCGQCGYQQLRTSMAKTIDLTGQRFGHLTVLFKPTRDDMATSYGSADATAVDFIKFSRTT